MSLDLGVVKRNLLNYETVSDNARRFVEYIAREISIDARLAPIDDAREYLSGKLDWLENSFDAYDYGPARGLADLTREQYARLRVYVPNIAQTMTLPDPKPDSFPKQRLPVLLQFLDSIKSRPPRYEGEKRKTAIGFPDVVQSYVNGEVAQETVLDELEAIAVGPGQS